MLLKNLLITFLFLFTTTLFAQIKDLPYSATWDTVDEQNEWTQYRLTSSTFYDWDFSVGFISHDYPVGNTEADTIRDWMVSPTINFFSTSKLSFQGNVFSLIGITETDYFGIWFSDGSKDPNDGDYVEIMDLTGSTVGTNMIDTAGIEIPFTTNEGYIAFVYEATDNWFTVSVDNVAIIPDSIQVKVVDTYLEDQINIFPNPTSNRFNLSISNTVVLDGFELCVFNGLGQQIFSQQVNNHQSEVDCSKWVDGVYFYLLRKDGILVDMEKIIVN